MIDRDRFLAKAPCDDACKLRWQAKGSVLTVRHGKREKKVDTASERYTAQKWERDPESLAPRIVESPSKGWLTDILDWLAEIHEGGEDW